MMKNRKHWHTRHEGRSVGKQDSLIKAVLERDIQGVSSSLQHIGKRDANGMTALMHASEINFCEAIKLIIASHTTNWHFKEVRGEIGLRDSAGRTALIHAAISGSSASINLLLPFERAIPDASGLCAIHYAAMNDDCQCISLLAPVEANILDSHGRTALVVAIRHHCHSVIPFLLESEGRTMVFPMATNDQEAYSSPEIPEKEEYGMALKMQSHSHNYLGNALDEGCDKSPLTEAVESLDEVTVRMVANAAKGLRDECGRTSLMIALERMAYLESQSEDEYDDCAEQEYVYYYNICQFLANFPEEIDSGSTCGESCFQLIQRLNLGSSGLEKRICASEIKSGC